MKAIWTGSPEVADRRDLACLWWNDFRAGRNRLHQRPSAKPFEQPTSTKFPKEKLYGSGRILGKYFGYAESRWLA